ncbi:MAG: hypothetical protein ACRENP_09300 [Longimicrobiales bacterium]
MNVDELLAADRELTDEEFAFLEQQALAVARELETTMAELAKKVGESDPALARAVMRPAHNLVAALEQAVAIP